MDLDRNRITNIFVLFVLLYFYKNFCIFVLYKNFCTFCIYKHFCTFCIFVLLQTFLYFCIKMMIYVTIWGLLWESEPQFPVSGFQCLFTQPMLGSKEGHQTTIVHPAENQGYTHILFTKGSGRRSFPKKTRVPVYDKSSMRRQYAKGRRTQGYTHILLTQKTRVPTDDKSSIG